MSPRSTAALALGMALTCLTATARAQDVKQEFTPDLPAKPADAKDAPPQGFMPRINLAATFAFTDNRDVIGQLDGGTATFGFKGEAGLDYRKRRHEFRNTLTVGESFTRTPLVDAWTKTQDSVRLESLYMYELLGGFGPFVRVAAETSIFPGRDFRPATTRYLIDRGDGTVQTVDRDRLNLTAPLRPTTFKESAGPFAKPLETEKVTVEGRAGLGARQVIANEQLAIVDDAETPEIEVVSLNGYSQLGAEAVLTVFGKLNDVTTYRLQGELLTPFAYSDLEPGDDRNAWELTNVEASAKVSVKLLSFLSVDYELRAVRQPQLLDKVQVQNSLLLALSLQAPEPEKTVPCSVSKGCKCVCPGDAPAPAPAK